MSKHKVSFWNHVKHVESPLHSVSILTTFYYFTLTMTNGQLGSRGHVKAVLRDAMYEPLYPTLVVVIKLLMYVIVRVIIIKIKDVAKHRQARASLITARIGEIEEAAGARGPCPHP